MALSKEYKNLLDRFPFLTLVSYGGNEYVGIIQNQDGNITSMYVYELIKHEEHRKTFLALGEEWWWGTNRQIPINIIMGERFKVYRESLVSFTAKDFEVIAGPIVCLRDILAKRTKRKNVQLIRKVD